MRIARLKLIGFKSFVEPTELLIEPGLTGVVGPNGCGKSNLLEALRWVMGETSHKSMRAAAMDDVIFSGTSNRPSRNHAEVSMVLDNSAREAPEVYNDTDIIEVTRRIVREEGSSYRVNGREQRARDIKLLFEDAATGARSPALVRQGQIGDIVNAKPEQRRRILEDAAGTAGLHSRRHDAELRLNAAEANLARLDDVVGGLSAQVESLKRQARQARRYKDLSIQIRRAEALLAHVSWVRAQEGADASETALAHALTALAEAMADERRLGDAEEAANAALDPLRATANEAGGKAGRLRVELDHFEREAGRAEARAEELARRGEQTQADIAREENFLREAEPIIASQTRELERLDAEVRSDAERLKQLEARTKDADAQAEEANEALNAVSQKLATARAERAALERTISQFAASIEKLTREKESARARLDELERSAGDAGASAAALREDVGGLEAEAAALETRLARIDETSDALQADLQVCQQEAQDRQLAVRALVSERETLERLLVRPDLSDSGAAPLIDQVSVTPGHERALAAAFGDDLEASDDESASLFWRSIDREGVAAEAALELPGGATALSRFVEAPVALMARLHRTGVVQREDGARLQADLLPGQRLVSIDGDLWRWDGFVQSAGGLSAAALRLAQRNRLEEIGSEEATANEQLTAAETAVADRRTELEGLRRDRAAAARDLTEKRGRIQDARKQLAAREEAERRIDSERAGLEARLTQATSALAEAGNAKAQANLAFAEIDDAELARLEQDLAAAKQGSETARAEQATARSNLAQSRGEAQGRQQRLATLKSEQAQWQQRMESAQQHLSTLKTRLEDIAAEQEAHAFSPDALEARKKELLDALAAAETEQREADDALAEAGGDHRAAVAAAKASREAVAVAREARARCEAEREAAKVTLQTVIHRIQEDLRVEPNECIRLADRDDPDAALPEPEDVERHLGKLKADRDRLGGVNLKADDDLSEIGEEMERIVAERNDVAEAVAKLRQAISQLNREGRKRLKDAFISVNEQFQRLFQILFDGGEARLELIENPDDPLAGGLDIIARPPGKKPSTLSLLSGGEQTLTALSLIFAVFLTNPSPICVLDEVDAPLDDANVDRFCTMMEKMAAETETRFLVITHHPMTMTRMNRLFGVTMAERGVSQLVSVDLETAQGFREAS